MADEILTPARVRELFHYDPETGGVWWKHRASKRDPSVNLSAKRPKGSYQKVMVDGKYYLLHRLAWAHYHGQWPSECIDHINRDHFDHRLVNLREATMKQNAENSTYRIGVSGLQGVAPGKANKWKARLTHHGKYITLGVFLNKHDAHAAYLKAKRELHVHCTI